jgi:hypothetical protein
VWFQDVEQPGHVQEAKNVGWWVQDLQPASGSGGSLTCDDQDRESAAVHERDPGYVDLDAVRIRHGQSVEQHGLQGLGSGEIDLADYGDAN